MIVVGRVRLRLAFCLVLAAFGCRRELTESARSAAPPISAPPVYTAPSSAGSSRAPGAVQSSVDGAVLVANAFVGPACARQATGSVFCWRWQEDTTPDFSVKWPVAQRVQQLEGAVAVTRSEVFSYLLRADGSVWAWGLARDQSRFGTAIYKDARTPERVAGLPASHLLVSELTHVYAFGNDGIVRTWTDQYTYDEDREFSGFRSGPPRVATLPGAHSATEDAGPCLVSSDGKAFCLRAGAAVWLPDGEDAAEIRACRQRAFVRTKSGAVRAWDIGSISTSSPQPRRIHLPSLPSATSIACKDETLYVVSSGDVFAWKVEASAGPVLRATGLTGVKELQLERGPSCVLHEDGVVGCWGRAEKRQIGGGEWPQWLSPTFSAFVEPLRIGVDISLSPPPPRPPQPRPRAD
jgi:hypothetical protein